MKIKNFTMCFSFVLLGNLFFCINAYSTPVDYFIDLVCTRNCNDTALMNYIGIPTSSGDTLQNIRGTLSFDDSSLPGSGVFEFKDIILYDLDIQIGNLKYDWDSYDAFLLTSPPRLRVSGNDGIVTDVHWGGAESLMPSSDKGLLLGYIYADIVTPPRPTLVNNWLLDLASPFDQVGDNLFFAGTYKVRPVPEPATMLLFGTGLAGLVGAGIRRKKKA